MSDREFTVIDVETTGLFHRGSDRIIEFAAIRTRGNGEVVEEYNTLINPDRDLGPTHIHGITGDQVVNAPAFREIAGDVLALLQGAVVVAHNALFDIGFIRSEYSRLGIELPLLPYLCTVRLPSAVGLKLPSRKLVDICESLGIDMGTAHAAYDDALATTNLLQILFGQARERGRPIDELIKEPDTPEGGQWPSLPRLGVQCPRGSSSRSNSTDYIGQLVSRLPVSDEGGAGSQEYMAVLDRVLEDRIVTSEEADNLLECAVDLGLTREGAAAVHREYMRELLLVAWADGVITDAERRDLDTVRDLLSLSEADCNSIEQEVRHAEPNDVMRSDTGDLVGKSVCFTGSLGAKIDGASVSKERAWSLAQEKGLVPSKSVTKKLDILIAADPHSMSGKAKLARKYGIRIMAESVFWQKLGVEVE